MGVQAGQRLSARPIGGHNTYKTSRPPRGRPLLQVLFAALVCTLCSADEQACDASVAAAAVVVYSRFSNRRGVFSRVEDHKGFPAYSDAESELSLWHHGSRWVCAGGAVGSSEVPAWHVESAAASPDVISATAIEGVESIDRIASLAEVTPADVASAPVAITITSKYSNVDGVYERQPSAHQHFPVYYSAATKQYVWHDLFGSAWVSSEEVGGSKYMWRVPASRGVELSPAGIDTAQAEGVTQILKRE